MAKKGEGVPTLVAFAGGPARIKNVLQLCKELLCRKHLRLCTIPSNKKAACYAAVSASVVAFPSE